jgi:L-erythro-3,5-diaminohexanoate dehydrogenase
VGNVYLQDDKAVLDELGLCHEVVVADATKAVAFLNATLEANGGREYDVVFNCVNVANTELSSILPTRDQGLVYFFSMATNFAKAALGAEGVGKDVTMIVGNGYTRGHAEITLWELRENDKLRKLFETRYV